MPKVTILPASAAARLARQVARKFSTSRMMWSAASASTTAFGSRASATAVAAVIAGESVTRWPDAQALGWLAYQTVWVVSVTFVIWFALIKNYSANRVSSFTFLTPLFGVAAGHLVLGDPLTPAFMAAVAMVAGGLILVNRTR